MPIVDIELVAASAPGTGGASARVLADSLGEVFGSQPGRTWVRVRILDSLAYAENGTDVSSDDLPVFVTVLHAHLTEGEALVDEVGAVTAVLARCLGRHPDRVHVQYAPAATGRQAFGGKLVS